MSKTLSGIILLMLFHTLAYAQHHHHREAYDSRSHLGVHELRLNFGMGTTDQYLGIIHNYETGFDFPKAISGADFISYRYYLDNWIAMGVTAGLDYQSGNMTNYSKTNNLQTGKYKRCAYTIAAEYTFIFMDKHRFQMYSGFGAGYTYYEATASYSDEYYNSIYSNYTYHKEQVTHYQSGHINGQITALGVKSNGRFSVCFELGFGYKGLLNLGLAYRF